MQIADAHRHTGKDAGGGRGARCVFQVERQILAMHAKRKTVLRCGIIIGRLCDRQHLIAYIIIIKEVGPPKGFTVLGQQKKLSSVIFGIVDGMLWRAQQANPANKNAGDRRYLKRAVGCVRCG